MNQSEARRVANAIKRDKKYRDTIRVNGLIFSHKGRSFVSCVNRVSNKPFLVSSNNKQELENKLKATT